MSKSKNKKGRVWATILYDEDIKTLSDKIEATKIPCYLSPCHDNDYNENGEKKKPHRHLMIVLNGPHEEPEIKEVFSELGGVGCERVRDKITYALYLTHANSKEKTQYNPCDVLTFNGAIEYNKLVERHNTFDYGEIMSEIISYIVENNTDVFADLVIFAKDNNPLWFRALMGKGGMAVTNFMRSRVWARERYKGGGTNEE